MCNRIVKLGGVLITMFAAGAGAAAEVPRVPSPGNSAQVEDKPALASQRERASYAIGTEIARNIKRQKFDVDTELILQGIKDAMAGGPLLLSDEDLLVTLNIFGNDTARKRARDKRLTALDKKKEGEEFLAENIKKEGVVALPSGLQYKIIKPGEGRNPTDNDIILCRYRGILVDGTEFENTFQTPNPELFRLSDTKVTPGLREALKLMSAGARWQLVIPPQLAYHGRSAGQAIGPHSTLIYELEVITIQPGDDKVADLKKTQQQ